MGGKTSDWKQSNIWNEARLPNKGCLFRKNQTLPQQNLGGSFFSIEIMWNQHPLAVQKRTTKNILVRMFRENGFPFHDLGTIPLHTAGSLAIDLGGSAWILFMLSFSYFCLSFYQLSFAFYHCLCYFFSCHFPFGHSLPLKLSPLRKSLVLVTPFIFSVLVLVIHVFLSFFTWALTSCWTLSCRSHDRKATNYIMNIYEHAKDIKLECRVNENGQRDSMW